MYRLPRNSYEFNTDPNKGIDYILSAIRGLQSGGVSQIIAGTNVTISPVSGTGAVTINASGGGSIPTLDQVTTAGNTTSNAVSVSSVYVDAQNGGGLYNSTYNDVYMKPTSNSWDFFVRTSSTTGQLRFSTDGTFYISSVANGLALGRLYGGNYPKAQIMMSFSNPAGYTAFGDRDGNEKMRLEGSTGNVLIGTTTDNGYKLQVNGDATINGVRVGLGGGSISSNTVVGVDAGLNNTSGTAVTAIGIRALKSNTTGSTNTAVGNETLLSNIDGSGNTAMGNSSMRQNQSGFTNTAFGGSSLRANISGSSNTAVGYDSLRNNTASNNTAVGYEAGYSNTSGTDITAIGYQSLRANTTGASNVGVGTQTLYSNTTGEQNTAIGRQALRLNTTGGYNSAVGFFSLYNNTTGNQNVAHGVNALYANTIGAYNTAIGLSSLRFNIDGTFNTAIGQTAGYSNVSGSNNVFIGRGAGYNETGSNKLYIGNSSTNTLIYGDFSTGNVSIGSTVDAGYKLDVNGSARSNALYVQNGIGTYGAMIGTTSRYAYTALTVATPAGSLSFGTVAHFKQSRSETTYLGDYDKPTVTLSNVDTTADTWTTIQFSKRSDTGGGIAGIGVQYRSSQNSDMAFFTRGSNTFSEKMRITSAGNVGIGTTSPTVPLEINQNSDNAGLKINGYDDQSSANLNLYVTNFGDNYITTSGFLGIHPSASTRIRSGGYLRLESYNTSNAIEVDANITKFTVSAAERMRIVSTGNVLIGTSTDAGYKLDVNGSFRVLGSAISGVLGIFQNSATTGIVQVSSTYESKFRAGSSVNNSEFWYDSGYATTYIDNNFSTAGGAGNQYGDIRFRRKLDGINLSTVLTIRGNNGNVGIGTTAPEGPLHVKYSSATVPGITIENDGVGYNAGSITLRSGTTGGVNMSATSNGGFYWFNLNTTSNTLSLPATGNLIVGSAVDAGYRLDVQGGDARFAQNVEAASYSVAGNAGYSGIINFPSNPPGQQNLEYLNGILINVF